MIQSVAKQLGVSWDEAEAVAAEAETLGWLTMEGRHSVCLTKAGRRLAPVEDDAWSTWLGEDSASPTAAKAVLKTMEGVNWQAAPEPKARNARQRSGKA